MLAGADKVSINTAAVKDINFVKEASKKFGTQCMVVAVDAKKTSEGKWEIFTHGGRKILELMLLIFLNKLKKMELEKFYLLQWIKTELKSGYDLDLLNKITSSVKYSSNSFWWSRQIRTFI